ncbi:hypothetical protein K469DRAFT_662681 [Zopfia rhizophila CBS 207.26]|uniref:Sec20 C-terminal domain-containing protein n=1 Tax=Zopfia rhizophila CBS 207.26 TaxID=1314779 RepID=A0A6A6E4W8_9PEZI|nr:hypothetical protein K469DRAFT_662681 [Zopfia rhizophila CBS 207.26]
MPLLPTTTQTLATRLNTLSEENKAVLQLVQRLSKLDFQPGSVPLNSEEGDARLELSAEIHESLRQLEEKLELLRQEIEDVVQGSRVSGRRRESTRDTERSRLEVLLTRLTEDLKSSRTQFRKAQLTAKRNADRAKLKERELLFFNLQSGSSSPSSTPARRRQPNSQLSADEVIVNASSDVTAALRRTQQLMQTELSRSKFAQETLEQSTVALADLGEKYTDLNTLLSNSKNLVNTLLKSQKSDTWYLETTFYILCTTIFWLIFRRWLYGPLWWFVWWPIKLCYKLVFAIFVAIGLTSSKSVAVPKEPSTSLIVKPSATDGIPKRPVDTDNPLYVKVGRGGRGWGYDPSPEGSLSREVGQMAEQKQDQDHPQLRERQEQQASEQNEPAVRGDGTVLQESDKPRNPKKRIWEENVEAEKYERAQQEQEHGQGGGHRKRDEL